VISRIRQLMATPFARPPGRRKLLDRFAPEVCAAIVYAAMFTVAIIFHDERHPLFIGAMIGYLAAAFILLVLPGATAAAALAAEHDRDTMEAMLLTPGDHAELAWGRFWHAAAPWLRFLAWLAPLYLVLAVVGDFRGSMSSERGFLSFLYVFGPKPAVAALLSDELQRDPGLILWGLVLMAGRVGKDALDLFVLLSIGYYLSARFRRGARAAFLGRVAAPIFMLTVFSAAEWLVALVGLAAELTRSPLFRNGDAMKSLYCLAALAVVGLEIWTVRALPGLVARNFDAYALGVRPESGPPTPRRRHPR